MQTGSFMKLILLSMPTVVFILYHYSPKQFDTSISLVLKPQNEVAFKFKRDLDKRKYMSFIIKWHGGKLRLCVWCCYAHDFVSLQQHNGPNEFHNFQT